MGATVRPPRLHFFCGEARRLIEQGGVSVDGEKNSATNSEVSIDINQARLIQLGKRRFLRVRGE